jgi:hypothetical protein
VPLWYGARMTDRIEKLLEEMAQFALRYPDATAGLACAGTAIESRTALTSKRAFVFLRRKEFRMKVGASFAEVEALAAAHPDQYEAGKNGWIKVTLETGADPTAEQWQRWIDESFRLMATKTRVRRLDENPIYVR